MQRFLLTGLCLLICGSANAAWQLGAGIADEIDGRPAGVGTVGWLSHQAHPWEVLAGYIGTREPRVAEQVPNAFFGAVSKRFAGERWFASSGLAYVSVDNEVLSGRFQFLTGAGFAGAHWTLSLRHLSNAGTNGRNRGETFLLLERRLK
jgi:hypothetical protein